MATSTKRGQPKAKSRVVGVDTYSYPIPVATPPVREEPEDHMMGAMGWIFAVILVAFFLPLGAMLYLDILDATHEVKAQTEKIEKLRREIERKNRDKNPDMFGDNPVFDRLRRPLEIPMSKPSKLGKN
jgi:hypothetical protein